MREVAGINKKELTQTMNKKDEDLPSLFLSILPIILPVVLISTLSIIKVTILQDADTAFQESFTKSTLFQALTFLGEPNIAMALAAIFSFFGCIKISTDKKFLEAPLITAGSIILITGAGGAYGGMIRLSGVGEVIAELVGNWDLSLVLIAWSLTAFIRIAQGSATVAMITGASLIGAIAGDGSSLGYNPIYLYLAIGFGSITLSWMNDSGFWLVQKLSGFSESEILKTWTVLLTLISVTGLVICLLGSVLLPLQ
jgi:GntP family gluconate:H+ symporter